MYSKSQDDLELEKLINQQENSFKNTFSSNYYGFSIFLGISPLRPITF